MGLGWVERCSAHFTKKLRSSCLFRRCFSFFAFEFSSLSVQFAFVHHFDSASATFHPFSRGVTEPFLLSFHPALPQSGGFSPAKLRAMLRGLEKHQRNNGEDTSPEANDSGELDDRSKSTA